MSRRVALVGCGATKLAKPAQARDLYTSTLFKLARRYSEMQCHAWFILSAKHGLVEPTKLLAPYEQAMKDATNAEAAAWGERVRAELRLRLHEGDTIVFLAGTDYNHAVEGLTFTIERPLTGLIIGKRMAWLKRELSQ